MTGYFISVANSGKMVTPFTFVSLWIIGRILVCHSVLGVNKRKEWSSVTSVLVGSPVLAVNSVLLRDQYPN